MRWNITQSNLLHDLRIVHHVERCYGFLNLCPIIVITTTSYLVWHQTLRTSFSTLNQSNTQCHKPPIIWASTRSHSAGIPWKSSCPRASWMISSSCSVWVPSQRSCKNPSRNNRPTKCPTVLNTYSSWFSLTENYFDAELPMNEELVVLVLTK